MIRFAVFEILSFIWKIFSKKRFISKTANRIKKVFWIKKTRNLIPRLYSKLFLIRFAVFEIERFLENIFQKNLISKTANRIEKVFWIKKTRNLILRLSFLKLFLIWFTVFEIQRFLENIFQKKLIISKTANRIKNVF